MIIIFFFIWQRVITQTHGSSPCLVCIHIYIYYRRTKYTVTRLEYIIIIKIRTELFMTLITSTYDFIRIICCRRAARRVFDFRTEMRAYSLTLHPIRSISIPVNRQSQFLCIIRFVYTYPVIQTAVSTAYCSLARESRAKYTHTREGGKKTIFGILYVTRCNSGVQCVYTTTRRVK